MTRAPGAGAWPPPTPLRPPGLDIAPFVPHHAPMRSTRESRRAKALRTAMSFRDRGDFASAIATVKRALERAFNDLPLVITLAKLLAEDGRIDQAEQWFRRAIALAPDDLDVRLGHATFLADSGQTEAGHAAFVSLHADLVAKRETADDEEEADAIDAMLAAAGVNHALCALHAGDHEAALRLASEWLTAAEHWEAAHDIIAAVQEAIEFDGDAFAEAGLARGQISPLMWLYLFESALEDRDFTRMHALVVRANELFAFDWQIAVEELEEPLEAANYAFRYATMSGDLSPEALAAWLAAREE